MKHHKYDLIIAAAGGEVQMEIAVDDGSWWHAAPAEALYEIVARPYWDHVRVKPSPEDLSAHHVYCRTVTEDA